MIKWIRSLLGLTPVAARRFQWSMSVVVEGPDKFIRVQLIAPDGSALTTSHPIAAATDIPGAAQIAIQTIVRTVLVRYGSGADQELLR